MPVHEDFSVDRNESISKNIDATGKKWRIVPVRGFALYEIQPMDDRIKVPESIGGKWTKIEWLQERLTKFLNESWDSAELAAKKQVRKEHAKKAEA